MNEVKDEAQIEKDESSLSEDVQETTSPAPSKVVRIMTFLNKENNKTYQVIQTVPQDDKTSVLQKNLQGGDSKTDSIKINQGQANVMGKNSQPPALVPCNYVTKRITFNCFNCKASYATQDEVIRHIKEVHRASKNTEITSTVSNEGPPSKLRKKAEMEKGKSSSIHCCRICKTHYDSAKPLYDHYKSEHQIDYPYLRSSKTIKQESPEESAEESIQESTHDLTFESTRKFRCDSCGVSCANKSGLARHIRNFHSVNGPIGVCHHCGNRFKLSGLPHHEKKCVLRTQPRRRQDCFYEGCKQSYYRKEDLIRHAKEDHFMEIEPMRTLKFANEEEFKKWKEIEEDHTFSYYSKHAGTKKNTKTYYCQHEGSERSHKSIEDSRQAVRHNRKGRIKRGNVCTSYMRVTITETEVTARYYPTHSHPVSPEDLKHQPLSKEIIKFVKEQIALNVPCRQIQAMAKRKLTESQSCKRDTQVSLKRITSMAQRYRRQQLTESISENVPNISVEAFNSFIEALQNQDESPVLLYQPPSEHACLDGPNREDHLFYLALQTADQQKMLQRDSAMPMFISITKGDYTWQYYLVSIVVPCEKNFEYPVGHLITSQLNEEVVSLFLQTAGEQCPNLNVNCIVYFDCPEIESSIKKVFGPDGPYFISKWHFLDFMKKDFLKSVPSNSLEELYDFILAMVEAENEERFLFLYNSFKEQYDSTFPDIVSNFAEYFVKASSWATCYRQNTGIIDSCLHVDSFFNKLNKKYRRRPSKKLLNLLPDLLLHMQESYRGRRENQEVNLDCDELIKEQHNMAMEIPSDLVQETLSRHWTVQASKHGQAFYVIQCATKCYENECLLRCSYCETLCSHMYFCTCDRSESICLHIHKIHKMNALSFQAEDESEDGVVLCDVAAYEGEAYEGEPYEGEGETYEGATYVLEQETGNLEEESPMCTDGDNLLVEAETTRENVLKNLEALRQVVDQRCVPEEMMITINDTLEGLCNMIGSS